MTTRIGTADHYRWGSHTALVHLRKDFQQLSADAQSGADPRVLAEDRAALIESRRQVAQASGSHLVDVTV